MISLYKNLQNSVAQGSSKDILDYMVSGMYASKFLVIKIANFLPAFKTYQLKSHMGTYVLASFSIHFYIYRNVKTSILLKVWGELKAAST